MQASEPHSQQARAARFARVSFAESGVIKQLGAES
jgi:hypothetical protein